MHSQESEGANKS